MRESHGEANAPSCERNREPIWTCLRDHFADRRTVLEIGSGTGQHAVYFAAAFLHPTWQDSDRADKSGGIDAWLDEDGPLLPHARRDRVLDVNAAWPRHLPTRSSVLNTLCTSWSGPISSACLPACRDILASDARLVNHGPFNYGGNSPARAMAFDAWLMGRAPHQAYAISRRSTRCLKAGLVLLEDRAMPSNNRCIVWRSA
ncbi:MAG: class I SAM-dependent methyltransferase [Rhodocyclaceae bacterium]|nr:class I SAM-dependent methyltransferase [Rhodocyclaceae bacterium]